jgi:transposase
MVFQSFQSLSPIGLLVDEVEITTDRICISARCRAVEGFCPGCGRRSESVHSHYERRLLDLPSHGRAVQLKVTVRRFRCVHGDCNRRIFAEPVGAAVAARSSAAHFSA